MEITFNGKRALVTGASRGIGRTVAIALARGGAHVFALARTEKELQELCAEQSGIEAVPCDLTDWKATEKAVESILPIHLLVNNAGTSIVQPFTDTVEESFDTIFTLNVKSVLNVSRIVTRDLIARNSPGSVVNVSSQAAVMALTDQTVYCASKAALDAVTRNMALELGPKKIRVNSVNPTVVLTELGKRLWYDPKKVNPMINRIPLGRFAEEEECSNAILFLLSDKASMTTGTRLPVEGGAIISGP